MNKIVKTSIIAFTVIKSSLSIGCMNIQELTKLKKTYSSSTSTKKIITMGPNSARLSLTFYFRMEFDNTMNHMTLLSFKDKNSL